MAVLTATCATFAATIAAAQPGDVVELPLQPARCGYVAVHNVNKSGPGVIVRIHPQQRIGLRLTHSSGIAFEGGWWEGAGSDPSRSGEQGAYVRWSSRFAFRNGLLGHPSSNTGNGIRVLDSSDFEITGMRTVFRWSTAINGSNVQRFRITDNIITADGARHATCTYPDGRVTIHTPKARCEQEGGRWQDSSHPNAITMWAGYNAGDSLLDGLIARNTITGSQSGITSHPAYGVNSARVWIIDNTIRTNVYPNGIRVGYRHTLLRGNSVGWPPEGPAGEGWGTQLGFMVEAQPTSVGCENARVSGGSWLPWNANYSVSCPTTLPPAPAAPVGVPRSGNLPSSRELARLPAPE
jgi:hypothetical protein